jgi:serine/threonine protein kinase
MPVVPRIPGYELLRCLGGCPLTAVWAARNCAEDTPCAVKVLRDDWEDQETAVKLLQREARAALAVRHRHLVRLLDTHVLTPPYYLVMEWLAGESLRCRLRRAYRLDVAAALWVTRQTAEALAALHRAGFVHGDVKPDNVRLVDDGTAVLIDLGFAHRPGENAVLRQQGYVLGTANYLAPELCAMADDAGPPSDVFSLGVTLYEMLTGRLPYPAGNLEQTFRRHRCDPPAIDRQGGQLPPAVAALVERMLARRPEDRPAAGGIVQQMVSLEIDVLNRRLSA